MFNERGNEMSIQQQQGDEERRRRDEEEAYAYESERNVSLSTAAYASKRAVIGGSADGFGNYGPDIGVDGSFGYREQTYNAQIRANIEYSNSTKEKRR